MRVAIVGSGDSWDEAPFDDPSVRIWGMNDGYGHPMPRFDAWHEVHPFDRLLCTNTRISLSEVPVGWYMRPANHMTWLAECGVPLYVQQPPPDWQHAVAYPLDAILAKFRRRYLCSGPAMAAAHAIYQGATWLGVFGCNAASNANSEYALQRPNLEWVLGKAEGWGVTVEIAPSSGLLKSSHVYAFESPPDASELTALAKEVNALGEQRERALMKVFASPWRFLIPWIGMAKHLDDEIRARHGKLVNQINMQQFGAPH